MSVEGCYVELADPQIYYLEVDTSVCCNVNNIEIERYDAYNLNIVNTDIVLATNIESLDVSKIANLDTYLQEHLDIGIDSGYLKVSFDGTVFGDGFNLDNYLDYYDFDGGTP